MDRSRYKKVYEDIMKKLDRLENDYLPQVSLAQKEVVWIDAVYVCVWGGNVRGKCVGMWMVRGCC